MRELLLQEKMLLITFSIFFIILIAWFIVHLWRVWGKGSVNFATANAGSNFALKIRYHIPKELKIVMPMGRGAYPLSLALKKKEKWESTFFDWAASNTDLIAILCDPEPEALKYWTDLSLRVGEDFTLVILKEAEFDVSDAEEVKRLINFHPILVYHNDEPFCMWVERNHPSGSTKAYNVEYVAPADMNEFQMKKFDKYHKVLTRLIPDDVSKQLKSKKAA